MLVVTKMEVGKKRILIIIATAVIIIAMIAFFVAQKTSQQLVVDTNNSSMDLATDPNKIEKESELIEGFPDFPVHPDAVLTKSIRMKQASDLKGYSAFWEIETDEHISSIVQWYINELTKSGWTIVEVPSDLNQGEQFLHVRKGEARASIEVETEEINGDESEIQVFVDFPLTYND